MADGWQVANDADKAYAQATGCTHYIGSPLIRRIRTAGETMVANSLTIRLHALALHPTRDRGGGIEGGWWQASQGLPVNDRLWRCQGAHSRLPRLATSSHRP